MKTFKEFAEVNNSSIPLKRLRDIQALPDDQLYLCYDPEIAKEHHLEIPFKCGLRRWLGGGVVTIYFYTKLEGFHYQYSTPMDLKYLKPQIGQKWYFDDPN